MGLNVPYEKSIPVLSLSDSVGKWSDIEHQKRMADLAATQEKRAGQQAEQAGKVNELKFNALQRTAHNDILTAFKTELQKKAQMAGIQPNTPEYQKLANATYASRYDKLMQNTGIPAFQPGTDIDLAHVETVMTPDEEHARIIEKEQAKQKAMLDREKTLLDYGNQYKDKADERNYQQSLGLVDRKHDYDTGDMMLEHKLKIAELEAKGNEPKPMSEYQQANFEAKQEAKKLATQGQLATFDTMLDTLDRVKNHPGIERATGKMAYLPSIKGSDAYNFEQSLETLKSQAFVPMVASLKGMGALSDAEGKKLTAAVGELDAGMSKEEFTKSIDRINSDISAAKRRIQASSMGGNYEVPAAQEQPQQVPPGYKMQRNKRTGETRLVPIN